MVVKHINLRCPVHLGCSVQHFLPWPWAMSTFLNLKKKSNFLQTAPWATLYPTNTTRHSRFIKPLTIFTRTFFLITNIDKNLRCFCFSDNPSNTDSAAERAQEIEHPHLLQLFQESFSNTLQPTKRQSVPPIRKVDVWSRSDRALLGFDFCCKWCFVSTTGNQFGKEEKM